MIVDDTHTTPGDQLKGQRHLAIKLCDALVLTDSIIDMTLPRRLLAIVLCHRIVQSAMLINDVLRRMSLCGVVGHSPAFSRHRNEL